MTLTGTSWDSTGYQNILNTGSNTSPTNHCNPGPGPFTYQASFYLPENASSVGLGIEFYADDQATAITLNGTSIYTTTDTNTGYDTLATVQDTNQGDFVLGTSSGPAINRIQFTVDNSVGLNPSGLDFAAAVTYVQPTELTYTGDTSFVAGQQGTLSATLTTNGTPLPGETVSLQLGGLSACSGLTGADGSFQCQVTPDSSMVGSVTISGSFAGTVANYSATSKPFSPGLVAAFPSFQTGYGPSSLSPTVDVFDSMALGAFVIGDMSPSGIYDGSNTTAYFWGSQWAKNNGLSNQGHAKIPSAMKGFADNPVGTSVPLDQLCGSTWTTRTGNSSSPPSSIPKTIYVIVSSNVTQSGSTLSGDIEHIDEVTVSSDYAGAPGHLGIGTITAQVC